MYQLRPINKKEDHLRYQPLKKQLKKRPPKNKEPQEKPKLLIMFDDAE
jgi:hypothetical protein